ncbi:hypothetical protein MYX77_06680 [Acidobacteriia bacterium AH_259_A11_L15]|nr:hypothetical protein [Acidobacteriia bacterium AH_259_A11_L15]
MTGRGTILALVSVVSLLAASCGNGVEPHKGIEIAEEHLAGLRAARTVRLIVEQSSPNEGVELDLPIEELARGVLEPHCGVTLVGPDAADSTGYAGTVRITATGEPLQRVWQRWGGGGGGRFWTGASVKGEIVLSISGDVIHQWRFDGGSDVHNLTPRALEKYETPAAAPFSEALSGIYTALFGLSAEVYGPDCLFNLVRRYEAPAGVQDPFEEWKEFLATAAWRAGPEYVGPLAALARNREETAAVRGWAMNALTKFYEQRASALTVLSTILFDESEEVELRKAAVKAIAYELGGPARIDALVKALDDPLFEIRMTTASYMMSIESRDMNKVKNRTIPVLIEGLEHATWRETALRNLRRQTRQGFGADAARWRAWWETNKERLLSEARAQEGN